LKHRTYDHINGIWHEKTMEYFEEMGFFNNDIEWCVTEKVHGSNFAFHQTSGALQLATRNQYIIGDKQFCQHLRMTPDNIHKCTSIWNTLQEYLGDIKEMIIYGEIFGGKYEHEDVDRVNEAKRIQKGVQYHPDIKFYAYDIWLKTEASEYFLDYDMAINLFEEHNMVHAKILRKGSFGFCKIYSDKFPTTIPEYFNLPEIPDNICEGIVLKPILGLMTEGGDRVILKSKNEKFLEVSREPKRPRKMAPELSENARDAIYEIMPYINENRLRNVLSKHGEFTKKEFGVIIKAFKEDIYMDFEYELYHLSVLDPVDKKMVQKEVNRLAIKIWKPIYLREVQ